MKKGNFVPAKKYWRAKTYKNWRFFKSKTDPFLKLVMDRF